jgi:hypothetical protein
MGMTKVIASLTFLAVFVIGFGMPAVNALTVNRVGEAAILLVGGLVMPAIAVGALLRGDNRGS